MILETLDNPSYYGRPSPRFRITVTTGDAVDINIATSGTGTTSINATTLADNHTLIVSGTDNTTITARLVARKSSMRFMETLGSG